MTGSPFPRRAVHLDFHTGPAIPDVGAEFDADQFAQTFVDARVDSVTVFAKCHHGHLYYDTKRPERHPGLGPGLDLLGEQIEALHRRGIRAPIYLSVQCDEYAANAHPEWIALAPDGKQVKWGGPLAPGWQILDMSSPYQEFVAGQIDEVLRKFAPTDGLFLDMCWDQPSVSKWAIDGMRRRGLDPASERDRADYARQVAHGYMARFKRLVDDAHKRTAPVGVWFNSRPKTNLAVERKFIRHIEVESLPTGGWGYAYFPYVARFVRPFRLPTLAMTARFHKSWADFGGLKPEAALRYECVLALSQGMASSVGDQMHPRGVLDRAAYSLIGRVYRHIESCEPWQAGAKIVSQIGVVIDPALGDHAKDDGRGLVNALLQLRHQFDLVPPTADLAPYELVIVPESTPVGDALRAKLQAFVKRGGALLVSGAAAADPAGGPMMTELGIVTHGESPYPVTYLRPGRAVAAGVPDTDHVMYERGIRITAAKGAKMLCRVVEPYFARTYEHFCSHNQTPPDRVSRYAAAVENGRVITFAVPIFTAYGRHGNIPYRQILGNCIDRLLPEPVVRVDGPAHVETSVLRKGRRTIVHLISFCPVRRTDTLDLVEDPVPLVDLPLAVKTGRAPRRVRLAPAGTELPFRHQGVYTHVRVTAPGGHAMAVFD